MTSQLTLTLKECWCDITAELGIPDPPQSFAKPDGVGALQLSAAFYKVGAVPEVSSATMVTLLQNFSEARRLKSKCDVMLEDKPLFLAAQSFEDRGMFLRIWFVSDGKNFAHATYICDCNAPRDEVRDCEGMIRTLRFER